jgi:hypothetical protein
MISKISHLEVICLLFSICHWRRIGAGPGGDVAQNEHGARE